MRVGVAAADPAVAHGLQRVFARHAGVEAVRLPADPAEGAGPWEPDVLVVDVWPPTEVAAEELCAAWHGRFPLAVILAVVHRPDESLLARLRRYGVRALWPKGDARGLVPVALNLPADRDRGRGL